MKFYFGKHVRFLVLTAFIFFGGSSLAQVKICSWNIQNLGQSKSAAEIEFMANSLRGFDIVALQEVVAGDGGAQAVARLADALNRKGVKWDYMISDPTNSSPYATERYAFLWKPHKVEGVRKAWLEQCYEQEVDREPYMMDFRYEGREFTLVNFHAIPKSKQPETEIKYFKFLPAEYFGRNLIFLGDFNLPQSHTVFNPLRKMSYLPVLVGQRTSLKRSCKSTCLASEYDNIFYNTDELELLDSGVLHFYRSFGDLKSARDISDHIPVWAELEVQEKEFATTS